MTLLARTFRPTDARSWDHREPENGGLPRAAGQAALNSAAPRILDIGGSVEEEVRRALGGASAASPPRARYIPTSPRRGVRQTLKTVASRAGQHNSRRFNWRWVLRDGQSVSTQAHSQGASALLIRLGSSASAREPLTHVVAAAATLKRQNCAGGHSRLLGDRAGCHLGYWGSGGSHEHRH